VNELTGTDRFQHFQDVRDQWAQRANPIVDSEKDITAIGERAAVLVAHSAKWAKVVKDIAMQPQSIDGDRDSSTPRLARVRYRTLTYAPRYGIAIPPDGCEEAPWSEAFRTLQSSSA
jgi:hypothetical protein